MKAIGNPTELFLPFVLFLQSKLPLLLELSIEGCYYDEYSRSRNQYQLNNAPRHSANCCLEIIGACVRKLCDDIIESSPLRAKRMVHGHVDRRVDPMRRATTTSTPISPPKLQSTTCRRAQMSRWRQKGFVQDSDDEEEAQLESQACKPNADVDRRVEHGGEAEGSRQEGEEDSSLKDVRSEGQEIEVLGRLREDDERITTPTKRTVVLRATPSPFTPNSTLDTRFEQTESPDPLQISMSPELGRTKTTVFSQLLGSPSVPKDLALLSTHQHVAASSQVLGEPIAISSQTSSKTPGNATVDVLCEFGIAPLSDDSDDDALSDPPSDLESPPHRSAFTEPHRRTAVQVVIPSSTALQRHLAEQASRREFRQRKPIQLHPYALEGELYRREVQSRGLKPVARARSPQRHAGGQGESQEKAFDPEEASSSSPPELEGEISTPVAQRSILHARLGSAGRRPAHEYLGRHSSAQLHLPPAAKKRRPNILQTQVNSEATRTSEEALRRTDLWSIPPDSPPYSSSPPFPGNGSARRLDQHPLTTAAPNLPTPSTSSVFQDDARLPQDDDSDSDPVPPTAPRSVGNQHRLARITLDDNSSSASEPSSEAEDHELRKVGRKIKGVLPASWLRFDKQIQERRNAHQRQRDRLPMNAVESPDPYGPQRGVAQRIARPVGRPRVPLSMCEPSNDAVVISDESDDGSIALMSHQARKVEHAAKASPAFAVTFDDRHADDDLSDMEDDRLHLPTLGGNGSKRKRQPKITDALGGVKKTKLSSELTRTASAKNQTFRSLLKKTHKQASVARRNPLPAMSIIDTDLSPAHRSSNVPQFLRVARRQALRRPDLARENLDTKQIRLHNAQDTEDANRTLRDWREGIMGPRVAVTSERRMARQPLSHKRANRQTPRRQAVKDSSSTKNVDTRSEAGSGVIQTGKSNRRLPHGLQIFTRSRTPTSVSSHDNGKSVKALQKSSSAASIPWRTAQLEGDEGDFGHDHRRITFEEGLRRADQQFTVSLPQERSHMNPQLARYLSGDDTVLPQFPTAVDIGNCEVRSPTRKVQLPKRRLIRKRHAQRIDVDTREYRQPSEPDVQEVLTVSLPEPLEAVAKEDTALLLQGLGPHGTRYPVTFDVASLASGTYFHSTTFIGSDEFQRALKIGKPGSRDLDEPAGYYTFTHGALSVRLGPWGDETSSNLKELASSIFAPLDCHSSTSHLSMDTFRAVLGHCAQFVRRVVGYVSASLCFSDPIDRKGYVEKMVQLVQSLVSSVLTAQDELRQDKSVRDTERNGARAMAYLLILATQTYRIATDPTVSTDTQTLSIVMVKNISRALVAELVQQGIPELGAFLEQNKRHTVREGGVQDTDVLVESTVLCMQTLESLNLPSCGFWDHVSAELSSAVAKANHVSCFEMTWATVITLLPFSEVDVSGIPSRSREGVQSENWSCLRDLLKRLFELYSKSSRKHGTSLNEYVRTNLARCHRLVKYWHWERPEQMLNTTFDFFGKNGLRQLRHEESKGSVSFLDNLGVEQSLTLEPNETAFHIALKCLALGLRGMSRSYAEKKIRSFVFRTIPNHGRAYPKDQPLDEESLAALRNHHDLLSVLYWAAPTPCRPKLHHIRDLVNHETSHREACRLNVRAWANLTLFQLSTEEPYTIAQPFAFWFKDIMHQSLQQYRLAKSEADDYLKSGVLDGTTDISAVMVRQTMERNQKQVIATLQDCIAGMRKSIKSVKDPVHLPTFLCDSDIVHLLELPHLEDPRLVQVIRDALAIFRDYATMHSVLSNKHESQTTTEESQDYGDFPDLDDFNDNIHEPLSGAVTQSGFDFIQSALWHLLSNAFGAEFAPDDNLLMDCVDTWVCIARAQVTSGQRTWSYYIDSYSQSSWTQLRQTEQARKFGPYFMAALIDNDSAVYGKHQDELIQAMLLSLVERESMLRFQHHLLAAIFRTDHHHPLLQNLPYIRKQDTNDLDVTAETLRNRRLALISSILSNMRDDVQASIQKDSTEGTRVRQSYAAMLRDFMATMKFNYQRLQQGSTVTGAYVEFVQKIVQFLKQYTNDICPVLPFFTDSLAFPLPAEDPLYIVARLCGYAPKLAEPGTAKQLSIFIQNVAQQAAANNHQSYLVNQLTTALCTDEAPAADREALHSILLQGIFPVYLEEAFTSSIGLLIAQPILCALPTILDSMIFGLRIMQPANLSTTTGSIVAIFHAFIRGTEQIKDNPYIFRQPHILGALRYMLEAMASATPLLEYICSRFSTSRDIKKPAIVDYMEELSDYITEMLQDMLPTVVPEYEGNARASLANNASDELLAFCRKELQDNLRMHWSENQGVIWFGQGQARREVLYDIGMVEEERAKLESGIVAFKRVINGVYGDGGQGVGVTKVVMNDVFV